MRYIFPLLIIFFIFSCCCLVVTASEIKAIEEATSYKIVVTEVPERGIASFYIELAFDLPCNISTVESDNFLVDYNIVNSTSLIAGAQGDVPGPTGDVTLCIVNFEGKTKFKILKAMVSDVDGNTILNTTSFPSPTLTPTPKPLSNGGDGAPDTTPSPSPTPASTPIVTPSSTFAPTVTPTLSQTPSPTTSPVVTPSFSPSPSPTPIPSQHWIPGFESAFAIAGLLAVAYLVLRRRKQSRSKEQK